MIDTFERATLAGVEYVSVLYNFVHEDLSKLYAQINYLLLFIYFFIVLLNQKENYDELVPNQKS